MKSRSQRVIGPLRIESLANGGAGVARYDGQVIFVSGTAPGDLVNCRLIEEKQRFAQGEIEEILEPAECRQRPPCPVADECGGCQWQHLPYPEQVRWKERLFHDTLIRHAGAQQVQLLPIVPAPREWGYRSRVQIKCHRTAKGFVCGFFRPKSHFVVPIVSCPVLAGELNELLCHLKIVLGPSEFAWEIPQIDLSQGHDGKCRAVIHYLGKQKAELTSLLQLSDGLANCDMFLQSGRSATLSSVVGDGLLAIEVGSPPLKLHYAAGGFAQINLAQNRSLVQAVLAAASLTGTERVLDLYCGMGNFSLPLAVNAGLVIGVEEFPSSIAQAKKNAAENDIKNVEFIARAAEGALENFSLGQSFDLVLLDPPRSGAFAVMKELVRQPVPRLLYVSCDPQTLARDLKTLLHGGYRLETSQPFDMFPQTYHCESLTILKYVG